jgi:peptidoglycan hydrolase-like protein with peptidoglycan-binding domain
MGALKLKPGSKGKLVATLQQYLNEKGKLPKPIPENGEFGPETKDAVKYFQKKLKLTEMDGTVGAETANALAKLIGPKAATFAKAFGEPDAADAKSDADAKDADKDKKATGPPANQPAKPVAGGKAGRFKNFLHTAGDYVISIPPNPAGKFPLLVLFAGDTKKSVMIDAAIASPDYFKNAVLVFGERNGNFSGFQSNLNSLLKQYQTTISTTSVCGYSSGGQAAFSNYDQADKKVGLIDPNIKSRNFKKFNAKAILSINPRKDAWPWADPDRENYTIGDARIDAVDLVKKAGGYSEITSTSHDAYPTKFLKDFQGDLI